MKKLLILLMAFGFFVSACNNNKTGKNQNTNNRDKDDYGKNDKRDNDDNNSNKDDFNQKGSWSGSDIRSFNAQCLTALNNDEEVARAVCPCLLEKFQNKYSTLAEMDKNSTEAEGATLASQCKNEITVNNGNTNKVAGGWPQNEKDAFVSNCVKTAMDKGQSRTISQNYCDCMLNKLESLFPDVNDAAKLTDEDFNSPAMEKMAADCLKEN